MGSVRWALQEHADGAYPGMRIALASSADTPFAVKVGRTALTMLEVQPGLTVWGLLMRDWDGRDVNQIGRSPPLSSNKCAHRGATHGPPTPMEADEGACAHLTSPHRCACAGPIRISRSCGKPLVWASTRCSFRRLQLGRSLRQ
eukprot:4245414-Prymnesium_polylepis.1